MAITIITTTTPRTTGTITAIRITATTMTERSTEILTADGLYQLMAWLSPAFPVGGYSYSHGIETAVERGVVNDRETLETWIGGILSFGAGATDALLFRAAHAALSDKEIAHAIELADAWRGSAELAHESAAQGDAFLAAAYKSWPLPVIWQVRFVADAIQRPVAYAVAVGAATRALPLELALGAYLQAMAANLVSAGVRLVPLGQTDGQITIAALASVVARTVATACEGSLDDLTRRLGGAAAQVDLTSMQHETQYTRLFRT
jgi:urease accessory protein